MKPERTFHSSVCLVLMAAAALLARGTAAQQKPSASATLASTRTAVTPFESLTLKLTIVNDGSDAELTIPRADIVSPRSLVAASYDRKGQWVKVEGDAPAGSVTLRPGESWTMPFRIMLPEALTKTPAPLTVQWVGSGPLKDVRSNEMVISVREDKNPVATLETSEGTIVFELLPDKAPNHVANFITLARSGFYDGRIFHRVIPNFMVQTGCPLGTGAGDAGYKIAAEFNDLSFAKGVVGMARSTEPNSAGSQFFICVADHKDLDNQYTAFGRVLEGQDVADKISVAPRNDKAGDKPLKDVVLKKVTVATPAAYQVAEVKKA